jgi:hypothetical protein
MGSFFKECGCSRPTRCPHPYTIRFRDALGKQREEVGYRTQDDAIERLTQIYAEKKTTAPSVAEVRRELGQQTIVEYAKLRRPRQQHDGVLDGMARGQLHQRAHHSSSRVAETELGYAHRGRVLPGRVGDDGAGRGNQVNIFRVLKAILRDAYGKGAVAENPYEDHLLRLEWWLGNARVVR